MFVSFHWFHWLDHSLFTIAFSPYISLFLSFLVTVYPSPPFRQTAFVPSWKGILWMTSIRFLSWHCLLVGPFLCSGLAHFPFKSDIFCCWHFVAVKLCTNKLLILWFCKLLLVPMELITLLRGVQKPKKHIEKPCIWRAAYISQYFPILYEVWYRTYVSA